MLRPCILLALVACIHAGESADWDDTDMDNWMSESDPEYTRPRLGKPFVAMSEGSSRPMKDGTIHATKPSLTFVGSDRPEKDVVAPKALRDDTNVPLVKNAGMVMMLSRGQLDRFEHDALPFLNRKLRDLHKSGSIELPDKDLLLPVNSASVKAFEVKAKSAIDQMRLGRVAIRMHKGNDGLSEMRMGVQFALRAKTALYDRAPLKDGEPEKRELASAKLFPMATFVFSTKLHATDKFMPQLELHTSKVEFEHVQLQATPPGHQTSPDGRRLNLDATGYFKEEETRKWLEKMGHEMKPQVLSFLNNKMANFEPIKFPLWGGNDTFKVMPQFISMNAMADGGVSLALDMHHGESCPELYPELPLDIVKPRIFAQGTPEEDIKMQAFLAVRPLNCFLRAAHEKGMLDYRPTPPEQEKEMVEEKQEERMLEDARNEGRMLAKQAREKYLHQSAQIYAKARGLFATNGQPGPLEHLEALQLQSVSAPRCTSSPVDGLVCDANLALSIDQAGARPTFNVKARLGLDMQVLHHADSVVLKPRVSKCHTTIELKKDGQADSMSRILLGGLATSMTPMICDMMPALVENMPKVDLGVEFKGSKVQFEDGYMQLASNFNPFDLSVLSLAREAAPHRAHVIGSDEWDQ